MGNKFWSFISYIFHPAVMPTLGTVALLWSDPNLISLNYGNNAGLIIVGLVFLCTAVLPVLLSWVLLKIGRVSSITNPTDNDRKILLSFAAICFVLVYYCFHSIPNLGQSIKVYMLAINVTILLTLFTCLFTRVSFHAVGAGGLLGTAIGLINYTGSWLLPWLVIAFAIVILVSLARYRLKMHNAFDIYLGLIIGIGTQALLFFLALPRMTF